MDWKRLPMEVQSSIYEFDDTYRIEFKKVQRQIHAFGSYLRRIEAELRMSSELYPIYNIASVDGHYRQYIIQLDEKVFKITIPFEYPFIPPVVFPIYPVVKKKCLWRPVNWTPVCTIFSLLLNYHVSKDGDCVN